MGSTSRDIRAILKRLDKAGKGCQITPPGRGGHWKVVRPGYGVVTISQTPSDPHALKNIRADIRRYLKVDV